MEYISALVPSIGTGVLFFFILRFIFRADRAERRAEAQASQEIIRNSSN